MNITLGTGKAVHAPKAASGRPLCNGLAANTPVMYTQTDADVTCKRCLKLMAAREAAAERTAYYAGLRDAQDETLSQAETAVSGESSTPAAKLCGATVYDPFRGLAFCTKRKHHDRTAGGPEHQGNYDEMDAAHAEALAIDAAADECGCPELSTRTGLHLDGCLKAQGHIHPGTGYPIVTVQGVRYVVGPWRRESFGNVDFVEYWLADPNIPKHAIRIRRAYADAGRGSVARDVWDAQRALR